MQVVLPELRTLSPSLAQHDIFKEWEEGLQLRLGTALKHVLEELQNQILGDQLLHSALDREVKETFEARLRSDICLWVL